LDQKYYFDKNSRQLIGETLLNVDILGLIAQHLGCLITRLAITKTLNNIIKTKFSFLLSLSYDDTLNEKKIIINENLIKKIKYAIKTNSIEFLFEIYPYTQHVSIPFRNYPSFHRNRYEPYIPFRDIDDIIINLTKYGHNVEYIKDNCYITNIIVAMICSYSYCYQTYDLLKRICQFICEYKKLNDTRPLVNAKKIIILEFKKEVLNGWFYPRFGGNEKNNNFCYAIDRFITDEETVENLFT
jgi:hypothetical protein